MLKKVMSMSLRIKKSEINDIIYLNNELLKDTPENKLGIIDLLVEINNKKKINIEIQNVEKYKNICRRFKKRRIFIKSKNEEELIEIAEKSMTLNYAMEQLRIINIFFVELYFSFLKVLYKN